MPNRKKPKSARQDNRKQRQPKKLSVVKAEVVHTDAQVVHNLVPPMPALEEGDKWLPESIDLWERYWTSDVAKAIDGADTSLAEQWITAHDEWRKATKAVRKARTVKGSMGQPVMNPLAAYAKSQAEEMRKCGTSLGIGPKERVGLGIDVGRGKLTAAQLNQMTEGAPRDDDADTSDDTAEILAEFDLG